MASLGAKLIGMNLTRLRTLSHAAGTLSPLLALAAPLLLVAQAPEIHPDRSVTLHYKDANATSVMLSLEGSAKSSPMEKDTAGVWTVTVPSLAPEIYSYHFIADGDNRLDPANPLTTINLVSISNVLTVPGDTPQPWEPTGIPHGTLHHHIYTTSIAQGLAANQNSYFVYTPPGYDPKARKPYPVLYLLHGWSDTDAGWTAVGRADLIFDSLLAAGRIKPMVVVMPSGYGDLAFVHNPHAWDEPATIDHNTDLFTQILLKEVLPRSNPSIGSPKTVTSGPSQAFLWAASKASSPASTTVISSPGSVASAPRSTILTTPSNLPRSIPKKRISASSGSPAEPRTTSSNPTASSSRF